MRTNSTKPLDTLTQADYEILQRGRSVDPDWFFEYYLKSPISGTTWHKDFPDEDRRAAWMNLKGVWERSGREQKLKHGPNEYIVIMDRENEPTFFHNHGPRMLDWQRKMHTTRAFQTLVLGGVGCGKTWGIAMDHLKLAAETPNYRGLVIAPTSEQVKQTWDYMVNVILPDTPYATRWVHIIESPYPTIRVTNTYVGESTITLRSLQDYDLRRILTKQVDKISVDQAESFENFWELLKACGTRVRGMINNRPSIGQIALIANASENEEMWQWVEMAKNGDTEKLYLNPWTESNPYLTSRDIRNIRSLFSTEEEANIWMHGDRPTGSGSIFTGQIVSLCVDRTMNGMLEHLDKLKTPDLIYQERSGIGIQHFEMPPDDNRTYIVIADPGSGNPPDRNSAVIMVWDVSEFVEREARLVGFNWVYGNGNYQTFVHEYIRMVRKYRAYGRNGFDATGTQALFDQLLFTSENLMAENIHMTASSKMASINAARFYMGKGKLKFPAVSGLLSQLSQYTLPEKTKAAQDIVMTLCMSAWYMQRYFYIDLHKPEEGTGGIIRGRYYPARDYRRYSNR